MITIHDMQKKVTARLGWRRSNLLVVYKTVFEGIFVSTVSDQVWERQWEEINA